MRESISPGHTPQTVIVTRHPALVELLRGLDLGEHSYVGGYHVDLASAPVIAHASEEDVRNEIAVGNLPPHMAALAYRVLTPVLELTPEDRGKELDLPRLREVFRGLVAYNVSRVEFTDRWGNEPGSDE